jgi:hypothetical protein
MFTLLLDGWLPPKLWARSCSVLYLVTVTFLFVFCGGVALGIDTDIIFCAIGVAVDYLTGDSLITV